MSEERVMDGVSGGIFGNYPPRKKRKPIKKKGDNHETNDKGTTEKVSKALR